MKKRSILWKAILLLLAAAACVVVFWTSQILSKRSKPIHASPDVVAGNRTVSSPEDVANLVKATIPDTWTSEKEATRLVVRPIKQPVFVNLVNADGGQLNESNDAYIRRHIVAIRYQIALRFEPKLSDDRVMALEAQNERIRIQLRSLERNRLNKAFKGGDAFFPDTPEGQTLTKQYEQLKQSIQRIPYGYIGNFSVYIEPTYLGFTSFRDKEAERECRNVGKHIAGLFTPYKLEAPNHAPN